MKEKLKTVKMIHLALCAGVTMALLVIGDLTTITEFQFPEMDSTSILGIVIPAVAFVLSNVVYKINLRKVDPDLSLEEKIPLYQTFCLVRWAIIEGSVFFILFSQPAFTVFGLALIAYMAFLHPTEDRFRRNMNHY